MSPESMQHAVVKVTDSSNDNVWITDRGTMLGLSDLVVDFRGIPVMKALRTDDFGCDPFIATAQSGKWCYRWTP